MAGKIQGLFTTFFLLIVSCYSQNTVIPDNNFEQALIDLGLDNVIDGFVVTSNISTITRLEVDGKNITDLTGIEDFTSLTTLDCSGNQLTNFNITNNLLLEELFCHGNQLNTIDVTKTTKLKILWCYANLLTKVDVSNNPNLISLICSENRLTAIDISNNPDLIIFICESNQISNIDFSQNPNLDFITCSNNLLTNIDLSTNLKLEQLRCNFNFLTTIDVSNNTELIRLHCTSNNISELNISNNEKLNNLICNDNQLTNLNTSNNSNLSELLCHNNNLEKLDVSENIQLVYLECHGNNLCTIDLRNGNNINLVFLDAKSNPGLACVFVDDVNYSNTRWTGYIDIFTNFVTSQSECNSVNPLTPQVDTLNDFNGVSYTLPMLNNGNYYNLPNGGGLQLNTGDIINTSQTIYIYNSIGCFEAESSFDVIISEAPIFIPKYFTPNNDGFHDLWKIIDSNNIVNNISIYNRHGKLIKNLSVNTLGWDGTLNNKILPNDTYWYKITLNNKAILRGYFALKR